MNLQEWMADRGFKDADVAERIEGLSRSQVSRIRRRWSIPPLQTARKLSVLTGIPVESFMVAERDRTASKRQRSERAA